VSYANAIEQDGFAVFQELLDEETAESLAEELQSAIIGEGTKRRVGKAFGIRNLLNAIPSTRALANGVALRSIVEPVLGANARVVRGVYFDKHRDANWKVAWHQDLTIAVREMMNVAGYGPWSMKAGIPHVQPPVPVLQNMLTVRVHLDHTDEVNGALRVLPGTHKCGRLKATQIQSLKEQQEPIICEVKKGGVMVMRPLLLHSSLAAVNPVHRRVLHFEYAAIELAGNLAWFEEARCVS